MNTRPRDTGKDWFPMLDNPICSDPSCVAGAIRRGMCNLHYRRLLRRGELPPRVWPRTDRATVFWARVDRTSSPQGCWLWSGVIDHGGYGRFKKGDGHETGAHRWAYEYVIGPIPDGLDIDHLCRVRHCVNPDHLEPVTRRENLARMPDELSLNARRRKQTHCLRGHEYTPENTMARPIGRRCRKCMTAATQRWSARKKAVTA